jgi:hypothetical protein
LADKIREAQAADRRKHPYRQIYQGPRGWNRLTPEEQQKANGGVVYFAILVFAVAICVLVFSLMTGIKFR